MAKAIMVQGTASNVGKTIMTLALCRIFKEDGYKVSPFKPQNMTANTCLTESGDEIAVSQWLQAQAAGITPDFYINPVVLKPSLQGALAVVNGKPCGEVNLYNSQEVRKELLPVITDAYAHLSAKYDIVVIEGAGSPVELNLNQNDIVNMGMAKIAKSPVVLVSDIDRGGVFASLYGTINLLCEEERAYVKALIVNRFKGEARYFNDGVAILEKITQLPVAGVVPAINIDLPEEDTRRNELKVTDESLRGFEAQFDNIAQTVRKALDMDLIYEILRDHPIITTK